MKQRSLLLHYVLTWCVFVVAAIIAVFLISNQHVYAAGEPFVTTWKTNAQYPSGDKLRFRINPIYNGAVDYTVDWGDGVVQSGISGDVNYEYSTPGTYTVKIYGDFPGFYFKDPVNTPALLLSVDSWGDIVWKNADYAFAGATIMRINAADAPDLSEATSLEGMFLNAYYINDDINSWDVSNIVNFNSMFEGAQNFDQSLESWDTSSAMSTIRMFFNARSFNQDISGWNTDRLVNASSMFEKASLFNQSLGTWNVSGLVGTNNMFSESGMEWRQYDSTLIGWSSQDLLQNRQFTARGLEYCAAASQRQTLISNFNWSISGDSENSQLCTPSEIRFFSSDTSDITIEENLAVGSEVGQFKVVDGDSENDNYSFDFLCQTTTTDSQLFNLENNSLILNSLLDYELPKDSDSDNIYQLCVRVRDQTNNIYEQILTVRVSDIENEQDLLVDNETQTGQVLGLTDEKSSTSTSSNENQGQVLADSDGAVLAETGFGAISAIVIGLSIIASVTLIGIVGKTRTYRFYK